MAYPRHGFRYTPESVSSVRLPHFHNAGLIAGIMLHSSWDFVAS